MDVSTPWPSSTRPVEIATLPGAAKLTQRSSRGLSASVPGSAGHAGARLAQPRRGFGDRAQNPVMRTAAAKIVVERRGDLCARRRRIAVEQRLGRDQNAAEAIAALARLLFQKCLLQRMRLFRRAEPFDRGDAAAGDRRQAAACRIFPACRRSTPSSSRTVRARSRTGCRTGCSSLRNTSRSGVSSCAATLTARPFTVNAIVSAMAMQLRAQHAGNSSGYRLSYTAMNECSNTATLFIWLAAPPKSG